MYNWGSKREQQRTKGRKGNLALVWKAWLINWGESKDSQNRVLGFQPK